MKIPYFKNKAFPSKLFIKHFWMWTWHYTQAASHIHAENFIAYERWKAWRLLGAM